VIRDPPQVGFVLSSFTRLTMKGNSSEKNIIRQKFTEAMFIAK